MNQSLDSELFDTEIPGGRARWWRPEELPPRKKRELDVMGTTFAPTISRALQGFTDPSALDLGNMSTDEKLRLTTGIIASDSDARAMLAMTDMAVWAYLKSWTLVLDDGTSRPLPDSPDAVLDLERDLYDALCEAASKIEARARANENGFTVDSVANPASPIRASAG